MGGLKGMINKNNPQAILTMPDDQRLNLLANIILEIVIEETEKE
jgi:hypothetical protein